MNKNNDCAPTIDRSFIEVLNQHRNGDAISEASAAVKQLTAAVQATGKPGKVTITLALRPAGRGTIGTVLLESKVKCAPPESEPPGSIFYADDDFNLVREDPNQAKLDLRVAKEEPAAPLRKAVSRD